MKIFEVLQRKYYLYGLHLVFIVILGLLVFGNTLNNAFHLDDYYEVLDNPGIQKVSPVYRHFVDPYTMTTIPRIAQYRPLLPLTLSFNYALHEYRVFGYHVVNLLFHLLATFMVYFLCLELLLQAGYKDNEQNLFEWIAATVAVVFLIHPVSGIPVNYICLRNLSMMQLFFSGSFLFYMRMRRFGSTPLRWIVILSLFWLALLSKTTVIVMPLLVIFYETMINKHKVICWETLRKSIPFGSLILFWIFFTRVILNFSEIGSATTINFGTIWFHATTQLKLHLFHYAWNFIWPFGIRMAPFVENITLGDPKLWLGLVFILTTLWAAWHYRNKHPLVSFCIVAYWLLIAVTSSIIPLHLVVSHYRPYASSMYLYLALLVAALNSIPRKQLIVICIFLVGYFSFASILLNKSWLTEVSLWKHSIEKGGDDLAHLNYAMSVEDLTVREKHLRKSLKISPWRTVTLIDLGLLLISKGDKVQGFEMIKESVHRDPYLGQAHYWLAIAYKNESMLTEAVSSAKKAAELVKYNLKYQIEAAYLLQQTEQFNESLKYLNRIEEYDKYFQHTLFLQGFAYHKLGDNHKAIKKYKEFLVKWPNEIQTTFNLAYAYMDIGNYQSAIHFFKQTLRFDPEYHEANDHLVFCYEAVGDMEAANYHRNNKSL